MRACARRSLGGRLRDEPKERLCRRLTGLPPVIQLGFLTVLRLFEIFVSFASVACLLTS